MGRATFGDKFTYTKSFTDKPDTLMNYFNDNRHGKRAREWAPNLQEDRLLDDLSDRLRCISDVSVPHSDRLLLTETSFNTLRDKTLTHSIGIISAYRTESAKSKNLKNGNVLLDKLSELGYVDITQLVGEFVENFDDFIKDEKKMSMSILVG